MKNIQLSPCLIIVAFTLIVNSGFIISHTLSADEIHVPRDIDTIQGAVNLAKPGDVIRVSRGTYAEHVVIDKSNIQLKGRNAIIDGDSPGLNGVGNGIHVLGTVEEPVSNVVIKGFVVRNFERGIVLENVLQSRVQRNKVRHNTDKDESDGCFNMSDGIVLIASHFNAVVYNFVRFNGHNGIFLIEGSSGNTIRNNQSNDNGGQTIECGVVAGCGIQLSNGDNNCNLIVDNKVRRNAWGILLGPQGNPTRNFLGHNLSHMNPRAGIAMLGDADGNYIQENDATGNGLLNLPPSEEFDLFDGSSGINIWSENKGTANF